MWRFWRRKSKPHFKTQYDDLLPVMYLAANKILHNAQDAEDAVQEALAVMCEKFTENSQNGCPKMPGYAVTICERKAIDIYRQKKRHVPLLEEPEAVAPDPEASTALSMCLDKLTEEERNIILMNKLHGCKLWEIAEMCGISEDAAAKRLQRAIQKLFELCHEEGLI